MTELVELFLGKTHIHSIYVNKLTHTYTHFYRQDRQESIHAVRMSVYIWVPGSLLVRFCERYVQPYGNLED